MDRKSWTLLFSIISILLIGCKSDPQSNQRAHNEDFRINVRIKADPNRLNPIFAHGTTDARKVYPYIFQPLGEYSPETFDLAPILAVEVPEVEIIKDGNYKDGQRIVFEILPDAVWDDGTPITAEDYIFTLKTILHPKVNADRLKQYYSKVSEANILSEDKKKFELIFGEYFASALEIVIGLEFIPAHLYDKNGALSHISYATFLDSTSMSQLIAQDTAFTSFGNRFNQRNFQTAITQGTGPYLLQEWETDQYILLKRKENYWGKAYPDRPQLRAYPSEILFQIVPDEITAITLLKEGSIDVMTVYLGENFANLKADASLAKKLSFHTPQLPSYYYLALNNQHPFLGEKNVRKALAHVIDVPSFIQSQEGGEGKRTSSIIPSFRPEYNTTLSDIEYDINQAVSYLETAGWTDTDGDHIADKIIDGKKTDLKLSFFTFKSDLSQRMGLLLKEGARKAGIDIELIQKKTFRDHWMNKTYDIMPMRATLSLGKYDPYNRYHSDNAGTNGSNFFGYENPAADQIMVALRENRHDVDKNKLYADLQEIMHDDQPLIFLYSPVDRIVTHQKFDPLISVKRPGYFINSFSLVPEFAFSEN